LDEGKKASRGRLGGKMTIEKVSNGYVIKTLTETMIYASIEEVFKFALVHFEGLSENFGGKLYGKVVVARAALGEK
jgi:hypothetical protein